MRPIVLALAAVVAMTGCSVQHMVDARRDRLEALGERDASDGHVWFAAGQGPTVVLVHGFGDQAGSWTAVARALAPTNRVIVPDLAAHGQAAPAHPMDFEHVYEQLVATLDAAGADKELVLVGNSLGGWLSLRFAIDHPERVRQVIAVDSAGLSHVVRRELLLPSTKAEMRDKLEALGGGLDQPLPGAMLQQFIDAERPEYGELFDSFQAGDMLDSRLNKLTVPTSLVWGADDGFFDLAYARRLQTAIPGSHLTVLPGCSHSPQYDCAPELVAAIREDLAAPPAAPVVRVMDPQH